MWIDTHCHLDAREFDADRPAVVQRARAAGVLRLVLPAVDVGNFDAVRALAHEHDAAYALGIHPMCTGSARPEHLDRLARALADARGDPRLVAVGEIGVDGFVPGLDPAVQQRYYAAQLQMAQDAGLPVLLHSRRAVDLVLKGLRRATVPGGIAHAFNGSAAQARQFTDRGFKLGFGGALTFDRALQIRARAVEAPAESLVMETDSPDIPPHWVYRTAAERAAGDAPQARNEPAQLPRIAAVLAALRGVDVAALRELTRANAVAALPRLAAIAA